MLRLGWSLGGCGQPFPEVGWTLPLIPRSLGAGAALTPALQLRGPRLRLGAAAPLTEAPLCRIRLRVPRRWGPGMQDTHSSPPSGRWHCLPQTTRRHRAPPDRQQVVRSGDRGLPAPPCLHENRWPLRCHQTQPSDGKQRGSQQLSGSLPGLCLHHAASSTCPLLRDRRGPPLPGAPRPSADHPHFLWLFRALTSLPPPDPLQGDRGPVPDSVTPEETPQG